MDKEFKKQRARIVRDLAEKVVVPFIKWRLLDLASRYENEGPRTPTTLTPVRDHDLKWLAGHKKNGPG